MRQRMIDKVLVTRPTREDVLSLKVGDFAPNCFGLMGKVTEIFARGFDIKGKAYACYYVQWHGLGSSISESIKEDEYVCTLPLTGKYSRSENYPRLEA